MRLAAVSDRYGLRWVRARTRARAVLPPLPPPLPLPAVFFLGAAAGRGGPAASSAAPPLGATGGGLGGGGGSALPQGPAWGWRPGKLVGGGVTCLSRLSRSPCPLSPVAGLRLEVRALVQVWWESEQWFVGRIFCI